MDQVFVNAKYIQSVNNLVDSDHAATLHRIITGLCRHLYLMNAAPNRAEVRREISVGWYVFFINKLSKKFSTFSFSGSAQSFGRVHHIADKECEISSETDKSESRTRDVPKIACISGEKNESQVQHVKVLKCALSDEKTNARCSSVKETNLET